MSSHSDSAPSPWVERFVPLIPAGLALDLACGTGRHSRWMAARGMQVLAVDRDANALQALASDAIRTQRLDLELDELVDARDLLQANRFAGIVVTNYLHRPLLPLLFQSLIDGGVLIYETFAEGNAVFGKPSNAAFLLRHGELIEAVQQSSCRLHVLAFEDGFQSGPRPAMVQRLCAIRANAALLPQAMVL